MDKISLDKISWNNGRGYSNRWQKSHWMKWKKLLLKQQEKGAVPTLQVRSKCFWFKTNMRIINEWPVFWIIHTGIFLRGQSSSGKITKHYSRLIPATKPPHWKLFLMKINVLDGCFASYQAFFLVIAETNHIIRTAKVPKEFPVSRLLSRRWRSPLLIHAASLSLSC